MKRNNLYISNVKILQKGSVRPTLPSLFNNSKLRNENLKKKT